jgi:polysaccharide export outer membrane protein
LSLVLAPVFQVSHAQDVTKPIIPVPAPAEPAMQTAAPSNPAPPAQPTSLPANAPPVSKNYVIGPKDGLSIAVWKEPTVSANVEVRPDGMITLPLLGDVKATDFTPTQLAAELTTRLEKYINQPLVTVTVLAINSKFLFFTGEGIRGAEMPFDPNINIVQAIIRAGGLTPFAKKSKIVIMRSVNGKQVRIPFDYKKALKTGDQQGVTLQPGDIVDVP